jgi:DNA mismatch repair protein MutH
MLSRNIPNKGNYVGEPIMWVGCDETDNWNHKLDILLRMLMSMDKCLTQSDDKGVTLEQVHKHLMPCVDTIKRLRTKTQKALKDITEETENVLTQMQGIVGLVTGETASKSGANGGTTRKRSSPSATL